MNCHFIPVENYIILIEIRNRGKVDKILETLMITQSRLYIITLTNPSIELVYCYATPVC